MAGWLDKYEKAQEGKTIPTRDVGTISNYDDKPTWERALSYGLRNTKGLRDWASDVGAPAIALGSLGTPLQSLGITYLINEAEKNNLPGEAGNVIYNKMINQQNYASEAAGGLVDFKQAAEEAAKGNWWRDKEGKFGAVPNFIWGVSGVLEPKSGLPKLVDNVVERTKLAGDLYDVIEGITKQKGGTVKAQKSLSVEKQPRKKVLVVAEAPTSKSPTFEWYDYDDDDQLQTYSNNSLLYPELTQDMKERESVLAESIRLERDSERKAYQKYFEIEEKLKGFYGKNPYAGMHKVDEPVYINEFPYFYEDSKAMLEMAGQGKYPLTDIPGVSEADRIGFIAAAKRHERLRGLRDRADQMFYDPSVNPVQEHKETAFITEANNVKAFYKRTDPNTDVEVLPLYGDKELLKKKISELNPQDIFALFGHAGTNLAGIPNDTIVSYLQNCTAEQIYLGTCGAEDRVSLPYKELKGKTLNYRPHTAWLGFNPNAKTFDSGMFSRNAVDRDDGWHDVKITPLEEGKTHVKMKLQFGGAVKDNAGYWNPDNWGKPVEVDSNRITMQGVNQPLIGISDTGDIQMMNPGGEYKFKGSKVTEFPVAQRMLTNSKKLSTFTEQKPVKGWLDKY